MELASNIAPTIKRQRRPRYRRVASGRFQLQVRDLEIIKLVRRYRLISSDNIVALLPGSKKGILGRLYFLFHGGFLERRWRGLWCRAAEQDKDYAKYCSRFETDRDRYS